MFTKHLICAWNYYKYSTYIKSFTPTKFESTAYKTQILFPGVPSISPVFKSRTILIYSKPKPESRKRDFRPFWSLEILPIS